MRVDTCGGQGIATRDVESTSGATPINPGTSSEAPSGPANGSASPDAGATLPGAEGRQPSPADLAALVAAMTGGDLDTLVEEMEEMMLKGRLAERRLRREEEKAQLFDSRREVDELHAAADQHAWAAIAEGAGEIVHGAATAVGGGSNLGKGIGEIAAGAGKGVGGWFGAQEDFHKAEAERYRGDGEFHRSLAQDAGDRAQEIRDTMNRVLDNLTKYQEILASTNAAINRA